MQLKDIEITRYSIFATHTLSQDEGQFWQRFAEVLQSSVTFLAVDKAPGINNTEEKKIEKKSAKKGKFVRLLKSGTPADSYIKFDNFERRLEAGIYLDAYLLNESVYKSFETAPDTNNLKDAAQELKKLLPEYLPAVNKLPADCFCYFVESDHPKNDKEEIFAQLLNSKFQEEELEHSYFAVSFKGDQVSAVIIPKDVIQTPFHHSATKLFKEIIQEYFLSFAKVVNESAAINKNNAQTPRDNLVKCLDWLKSNRPQTIRQVEYTNRELAKYRSALADALILIETHIHTIEINIRNAGDVLNYNILKNRKENLIEILVKPLQYRLEQIKADLDYLKIYDNKAKIKAEEITSLSNLQAGIYGRKLAWFLGFLSLIAAFQLFEGFMKWGDTTAKIILIGAIILIPLGLFFFKDILDLFDTGYEFKPQAKNNQPSETDEIESEAAITENQPQGELPPVSAQTEISNAQKTARRQHQ